MSLDTENPWRRRFAAIYDTTIHVTTDQSATRTSIRDAAHDLGMMCFLIDGARFATDDDVDQALANEVMPPFPFRGPDAQYSVLTNLEWFGNDVGYVLAVGGCDEWLERWPEGFSLFVAVTVASSRLWQGLAGAFHVVFLGGDTVAEHVEDRTARELRERVREFDVTVTRYAD